MDMMMMAWGQKSFFSSSRSVTKSSMAAEADTDDTGLWTIRPSQPPSDPTSWPLLANETLTVAPVYSTSASLHASCATLGTRPTFSCSLLFPPPPAVAGVEVEMDLRRARLSVEYADGSSQDARALAHLPGCVLCTLSRPASAGAVLGEHEVVAAPGEDPDGVQFSVVVLPSGGGGGAPHLHQAVSANAVAVTAFVARRGGDGVVLPVIVTQVEAEASAGRRRSLARVCSRDAGASSAAELAAITCYVRIDAVDGREDALRSAYRTLSSVLARDGGGLVDDLVSAHDAAWARRWSTHVDLPRTSEPSGLRLRRALAYAMYNLHIARPGDPLTGYGRGTWDSGLADAFVLPALVLLRPDTARASLDRDAEPLRLAATARAAVNAGLRGRRTPYGPGETRGVALSPRPLGISAPRRSPGAGAESGAEGAGGLGPAGTRLLATAALAVSAWNYYRTSGDVEWLRASAAGGFALIKGAADAVASVSDLDAAVALLSPAPPSELGGGALVAAACAATLRVAIDASVEMGHDRPPEAWVRQLDRLQWPASSDVNAGSEALAERLVALIEPWGSLCELDLGISADLELAASYARLRTLLASSPALLDAAPWWVRPVLLSACARVASRGGSSAAQQAELADTVTEFLDALGDDDDGGFGNLTDPTQTGRANDLSLSAMLLLGFVCGVGGSVVQGGGASSAQMGVSSAGASRMPEVWGDRLLLEGLGGVDVVVLNTKAAIETPPLRTYETWSVDASSFRF